MTYFFSVSFALLLVANAGLSLGQSNCFRNVDLNTCRQEGDPSNGNWVVSSSGLSLRQTINGEPTFFVSPDTFINARISGTISVDRGDDNDFVGFVFGYRAPNGNSSQYQCWLFDWKKENQTTNSGRFAREGMSLVRIQGDISGSAIGDHFWSHQSNSTFEVVASNWGRGKGWKYNTSYDFELTYTATRITVFVDGDTIFDVNGCFKSGRFGFYN